MKCVIIFGPQAVGKMTVGQELSKVTKLKLFHNHMTIDLVSNFFDYSTPTAKRLVTLFREAIFREVAKSDMSGLIFTFVCCFNTKEDWEFLQKISQKFIDEGGDVYYVELEADIDERLKRNISENRLYHKPSKRNVAFSEKDLRESVEQNRLNSSPGEIKEKNYMRINNTNISPDAVAQQVKEYFNL